MFALALGDPGNLWTPYLRGVLNLRKTASAFGLALMVMGPLSLVSAYLTDRRPLLGSRREGYLLVGCAFTLMGWAAAPFVPLTIVWGIAVELILRTGAAISFAALHGAVVELSRRHGAPGRLAAGTIGLPNAAALLATPLFSFLGFRSLFAIAGLGAAIALSMGLVGALFDDAGGTEPVAERSPPPPLLRSRTLWGALAFLTAAHLFGQVQRNYLLMAINPEIFRSGDNGFLLSQVAVVATAVLYALLARRLSTGTVLRISLIAQAIGFASWFPVGPGHDPFGPLPRAVADGCMFMGMATLAIRAAPRAREAFGYALMMGIPAVAGSVLIMPACSRCVPAGTLRSGSRSSGHWPLPRRLGFCRARF
jgi:hypothetical protein